MMCAIASGKGGTGKTTAAVSPARALGSAAQAADGDVEESNPHIFRRGSSDGDGR